MATKLKHMSEDLAKVFVRANYCYAFFLQMFAVFVAFGASDILRAMWNHLPTQVYSLGQAVLGLCILVAIIVAFFAFVAIVWKLSCSVVKVLDQIAKFKRVNDPAKAGTVIDTEASRHHTTVAM